MAKVKRDQTTEEKILAAARKVFIRDGMAGARMQDIADEAGMNKALLHYYFSNKQKLFETIFHEATTEFLPRMNEILESDLPVFDKIRTFCSEYIAQIARNPFIPLFLLSEVNKQPEKFLKKMWGNEKPRLDVFAKQLMEEAAKGNIKPIHPGHLFMHMFGMCVFPFIGKPLVHYVMNVSVSEFDQMMEQRRKAVPEFIIEAIKK